MSEDEKIEEEKNQDGLDELIDLPAEEPEVQPDDEKEPVKTEEPEEPVEEPADSDEPKPEVDGSTEEIPEESVEEEPERKIKFRGEEYSLSDLQKDPKLLENLVTAANQQTNYQRLHDEDKNRLQEMQDRIAQIEAHRAQQLAEAERAAQERQAQEQQKPPATPEEVAEAYKPALKKLVKEGWIEEDVEELYPNAAIGLLTMRDELFQRMTMLERAVGVVGEFFQESQQKQQVEQAESVMGRITGYLSDLSKEGDIYAPLADPEKQKEFLSTIRDRLNPPIKMLLENPDIMREYWIGANHQALLESVQKVKQSESAKKQKQRQLAAGEGSSARPSAKTPATLPGEEEGWGDL